jgi:hypothetical protein
VAERRFEVVATREREVLVRALGACSECRGCGGRCDLFRGPATSAWPLPAALFPHPPRAGERWLATLGERELLQQSLRGHGAALLGLVGGGALGHAGAAWFGAPPDAATALGAALGTLLALRLSKRTPAAALRLLPDAAPR